MADGSWLAFAPSAIAISHQPSAMMRVRVFDTASRLARAAARDVARALRANPRLVLGLPTGRTPIPLYDEIARLHGAGRASFRRATTFNLDEFLGLDGRDPRSYRAFMQRHLFDHVDLTARRIHFLNGTVRDVAAECERYERAIRRAGRIDLQLLGLGTNGHIGFNEPARALAARTHCARLTAGPRPANAPPVRRRVSGRPPRGRAVRVATHTQTQRI